MKQVPETKIKLTEVKEMMDKGYGLLEELRQDAGAPVVKAELLNEEMIITYGKKRHANSTTRKTSKGAAQCQLPS
ncbi:hypothetical protein [Salinicoccus sp. CNSTN-B1]